MGAWDHVWWLGGSPCSGKSSAAEVLAARHGMRVYSCDAAFDDHVRRAPPGSTLGGLRNVSLGGLFMRPPGELARLELAAYADEFALILDDLRELDGPVLAEGAALAPDLLAGLAGPGRAAFVVPDAAFQWRHYSARPWARGVVGGAVDPERAFANWMGRDALFARRTRRAARAAGRPVLVVDGSAPLAATIQWLETALLLP